MRPVSAASIRIDGAAKDTQRLVQVALLGALRRELDQRHGGAGSTDDGQGNDQFDECETPCAHFLSPHYLMAMLSGCDAAFAIAVPDGPIADTCAAIELAGARPRFEAQQHQAASPWMGSSVATTSIWAPPLFASTVGLPALEEPRRPRSHS